MAAAPIRSVCNALRRLGIPRRPKIARTCAVRGCDHVADAGHLTDYCFAHACEIKRFALWLRYEFEDAHPRRDHPTVGRQDD